MITSPEQYQQLESELLLEIQKYEKYIDAGGQDTIMHFFDHSELEMAFEILCLDLMLKCDIQLNTEDAQSLIQLGLELGLDKKSIYDPDFWGNFTKYLDTNS